MGALDTAVRSGRALYAGHLLVLPGAHPGGGRRSCASMGTPLLIHQPSYSMLNRWVEQGRRASSTCSARRASAASPSARWRRACSPTSTSNGIPEDSRAAQGKSLDPRCSPTRRSPTSARLNEIAARRGQSLAQLALSWVLRDRPRHLGADRREQRAAARGRTSPRWTRHRSPTRSSPRSTRTPSTPGSTCGSGPARPDRDRRHAVSRDGVVPAGTPPWPSSGSPGCGRMTAVTDDRTNGTTRTPRAIADRYVDALVAFDPMLATSLGAPRARTAGRTGPRTAQRPRRTCAAATLAELDAAEAAAGGRDRPTPPSGSCARLLRERLEAQLATSRRRRGPARRSQPVLARCTRSGRSSRSCPTATDEDWATVAARLARVPEALDGYRRSLAEGRGPRARRRAAAGGRPSSPSSTSGWHGRRCFAGFARRAARRRCAAELRRRRGAGADAAVAELRDWLRDEYAPAADGAAGRRRPGALRTRWVAVRWTGADLDLDEAYAWGWAEYRRILARACGPRPRRCCPARPRWRRCASWTSTARPIEGVEEIREPAAGDDGRGDRRAGRHALRPRRAGPPGRVDDRPAGQRRGAVLHPPRAGLLPARPHLAADPGPRPASRSGTWSRTWYHEGVPGHHLQLAQWAYVAPQLSTLPDVARARSAPTSRAGRSTRSG